MNKKVLIVDDSMFMRTLIKKCLVSHGYEIIGEAADGTEAVSLYKDLKPDVVTMDITMPTMDGITALTTIKQFDPNALVVMVTAMGQQAMVIECIQSGAKDFIVKPFNSELVIKTIDKLFE